MYRRTKTLLPYLFLILLASSCKKAIQNVQEDLVIKAMTDGQWKVTAFSLNGNNITPDFTNYRFKYYSDKTVDALNNGSLEKKGNWDGDASTMTTYANFSSPTYPLNLINGNWTITRNSWTYVEAYQNGTDSKTMRLDKQ